MKPLKNITAGFIVSFLGSLPLSYLNIIGVEVFSKFGLNSLVFLFGRSDYCADSCSLFYSDFCQSIGKQQEINESD